VCTRIVPAVASRYSRSTGRFLDLNADRPCYCTHIGRLAPTVDSAERGRTDST
jgi:hypothetical protein